jgi:hypothetical protein
VRLAVVVTAALVVAPLVSNAAVYEGRDGRLRVPVPRLELAVAIDGALDEPAWREAAVLSGFSQYAPADGRQADERTEVLVWYAPDAIHFGIRAHAAPGTVHATLADRDRIDGDDYVQIFLSTFDDGREALMFGVNPLGVQSDGALSEGVNVASQSGGGFSGLASGRDLPDLSPDYVFESRGRVTAGGYEIEIRIPFRSLRFKTAPTQDWGIHVIRRTQATGHEDSWVPAVRAASSFLAQAGRLEGLTDLRRGLVLDLNPVVTTRVDGASRDGGWHYDGHRPEFGANVRWGLTSNLALNGTVNPDFSQVEADASQFTFDPRQALFFAEKRPFFLEGLEQFATPNRLIYTRRVVAPLGAVRLAGKARGFGIAALTAVDDPAVSHGGTHHPVFNILRVQRDVGTESRLGLVYTDRIDGQDSNRVLGLDARLSFRKLYSLVLQAAGSRTERDARTRSGPLFEATLGRDGRRFGFEYEFHGVSDRFVTESGLIARDAIVRGAATHRLQAVGEPGALLERWVGDVALRSTWDYRAFFDGGDPLEQQLHVNNNFTLRGGWKAGGSVLIERFGYDASLYTDYALERVAPGGTVEYLPFPAKPSLPNLDYVATLDTPEFKRFSGGIFALWGRDDNFYEWSAADILFLRLDANWRPTDQLRVTAAYQVQEYWRASDGSIVGVRRIPRLKAEYQATRSIFLRAVGEYSIERRDALRDDARTELPIAIRNASTGLYERTNAWRQARLRVDWLFSYQPTPGTVVFAGYGSTLADEETRRPYRLERRDDGFFAKVSYAWRL